MQSTIVLVVLGISTMVLGYTPRALQQQPQRGLLVLPIQQTPQKNSTSQTTQDELDDSLDQLSANLMARLQQQIGSNTGFYFVYLPNGRLQKIQYTTAPIRQQKTQQAKSNDSVTNQNQTKPSNQYKQNSFGQASNTPQGTSNQQSNTQIVFGTNKETAQGNQQQQYRESNAQSSIVQQQDDSFVAYQQNGPVGNPSQLIAQYNAPERLINQAVPNYIAGIQYTDVPPIHGPVYAYRPSPLVRIIRHI